MEQKSKRQVFVIESALQACAARVKNLITNLRIFSTSLLPFPSNLDGCKKSATSAVRQKNTLKKACDISFPL